jgi:hypothetical protein
MFGYATDETDVDAGPHHTGASLGEAPGPGARAALPWLRPTRRAR